MGATEGLRDHLVDESVREIPPRGQGEAVGRAGVRLLVRLLPEDGGAALGRDDRVPGVLEHRDPVGDGDPERAARTALADHDRDDGGAQAAHLEEVHRDRLRLAALLAAEAGVGAGRVDEGHDRKPELLGELHLEERLAVALGMGAAEVGGDLLGDGLSLVVDDHEALDRADPGEAGDDGRVVSEGAVAVELAEVAAHRGDVVHPLRTERVARDAHGLPGREVGVDLLEEARARLLELAEFVRVARGVGAFLDRVDLTLDLEDGVLEVELVERAVAWAWHSGSVPESRRRPPAGARGRGRGSGAGRATRTPDAPPTR